MGKSLVDENEAALGVTFNVKLDDARVLNVQTHVRRDASAGEINTLFDKIGASIDRQQMRYRLKDLKIALEQHEKTLVQLVEDRERIDRQHADEWARQSKKGDWSPDRMPQQARNDRSNAEVTARRYRMEIAKIKAEIAEAEKVLAATAATE